MRFPRSAAGRTFRHTTFNRSNKHLYYHRTNSIIYIYIYIYDFNHNQHLYLLYVLQKFWCKLPEDDNVEITETGTVHLLCVTEVRAGYYSRVERHTCSTIQERHLRQNNLRVTPYGKVNAYFTFQLYSIRVETLPAVQSLHAF